MRHRFEVEELPPDRWARIEREVFDRLDREEQSPISAARPATSSRRPIVTFVLAGAAAAVIGAVAWETLRPSEHGELAGVSRVTTDAAATHVQVGENALEVSAHSSVAIHGNDGAGIEIALDQGDIECEVAPRRGRPPFVVSAGDVRVRVVGTHFHVTRHGEQTRVSVDRGTVEVSEHANVTLVHAGESWPPPAAQPPAAAPVDTKPAATTSLAPAPAPARSATAPAVANGAQGEVARRERYEKALGLESSQPDAALSTYRELAAGSDAWAMNALFAEARLELERGHTPEARRLASDYLSRFPSGPNARDARELRARLE